MCGREATSRAHEFEISIRFRRMMEERIARLEADAASDEAMLEHLEAEDQIRRQMRLVALLRRGPAVLGQLSTVFHNGLSVC